MRFFLLSVALGVAWTGSPVRAEDWPAYQHDASRSGITAEGLSLPLVEAWVYQPRHAPDPAWGPPKSGPVEDVLELRRNHFDDVLQVAAAAGRIYFGSSADGKIYCLDASNGKILWTKTTGGPVRLAPTVYEGRVYAGSDDGYAYCLDARNGSVVWQFRAAPEEKRVLGSRRMISLWPLRSGVLVDQGVAYLAAGIFPAEGVFFYALDAKTGKVIWRNDSGGEAPQSQVSPQGYLLASQTTLYAPMGRVSPAALDRRDGTLKHVTYFGKNVGGTYALLADDQVYTGTEELVGYQGRSKDRFATYPGRKIIVGKETVFLAGETRLSAINRKAYPAASSKVASLRAQIAKLQAAPKTEAIAPTASAMRIRALSDDLKAAEQELAGTIRWETPCMLSEALIVAGDVLVVGGAGQAEAVDSNSGKTLWRGKVEGNAKGLAVSDGRLLVSTDTGKVYCFAAEGAQRYGTVTESTLADPYKDSLLGPLLQQAAEAVLNESGIRRGYCLVLDCQTGQLALELARRSELMIYAVSSDAEKVATARKNLDAAWVYGTRVYVDCWPAGKLPYSDYFANLVVSEGAIVKGSLPTEPAEMFRILKPLGGTALLGQPAQAGGIAKGSALDEAAVRRWLEASKLSDAKVIAKNGLWAKVVRGPIPGAGSWTHEYGDTGNTGCGDDRALRCPLEVLWFGDPGPGSMVSRHLRAAAPLVVDGRVFIQGENALMAYDAYNGVRLWERAMSGAIRTNASRDASNLAASHDALFVAVGDQCLRLDPATGQTVKTYRLPSADDGKPRRWGYVASSGKRLYGSRSPAVPNLAQQPWSAVTTSDCVFALDAETGQSAWVYEGKRIPHQAIAIDGGAVLLVDRNVDAEERRQAIDHTRGQLQQLPEAERAKAEQALEKADICRVVAVDAQNGQIRWRKAVDLTHCGEGALSAMVHNGILLLFGVYTDGHYWQEFFAGQFADRRITALATEDGNLLWSKPVGYRVRPIIIGDTLHAEPWAFDLRTAELKTRIHPITGQADRWQYARPGHHCGCPIGTPNALFFRSWCLGYYDLLTDSGTAHFGGQRPGCWINAIPAGGLLVVPEASAGCMCAFPNMCSVAFKPAEKDHAYTYYSVHGPLTPVERLGILLGAPGDRKDSEGRLWLGYPRPKGSLVLQLPVEVSFLPGGAFVQGNSRYLQITGADEGWLLASAAVGLKRCVIPLLAKGDPPARYLVRLALADPDNAQAGRRLFTVKLQDKPVLKDFDIVKESGGQNRAVFKEFSGIEVNSTLAIELVPKTARPALQQAPILHAVEMIRERLPAGGPGSKVSKVP